MIKDLLFSADISSVNKVPLSGRYIYFILDGDDTIIYIGQTCRPDSRVATHRRSGKFNYLKMVKVDDEIDTCDAEFMEIIKHKPMYNKEIKTPTFLTVKSRIMLNGEESTYHLGMPDLHLTLDGKDKYFWLKSEHKGSAYFESLLFLIRRYEKESNANHAMLNRLINELENK